jgi:hypothetical protein
MRQAMEGGSLEHNIRKVMEEKAKREGTAVKVCSTEGTKVVEGVETAFRDAQGGIWWDEAEEWEFAHLLAAKKVPASARCVDSEGWVTFDNRRSKKEDNRDDFTDFSSLPSSKCTDLHYVHPLLVSDDSTEQLVRCRTKRSSSVVGSIVLPSPSIKPSKIILAIPSRPTRAKHLQPGFLRDVVAVPPTPSTASTFSQSSSHPRSPGRVTRFVVGGGSTSGPARRQRSRSRSLPRKQRKPAPPPLKIVPLGPATKLAVNVEPEDDGKRLFLEDSFRPEPIAVNSRGQRNHRRCFPSSAGRVIRLRWHPQPLRSCSCPQEVSRSRWILQKERKEVMTKKSTQERRRASSPHPSQCIFGPLSFHLSSRFSRLPPFLLIPPRCLTLLMKPLSW